MTILMHNLVTFVPQEGEFSQELDLSDTLPKSEPGSSYLTGGQNT